MTEDRLARDLDYVIEIMLPVDADLRERIEADLYLSGSTGSVSRDADEAIVLTAWFPDRETRDAAAVTLRDIAGITVDRQDRERVDWLEQYEQSLTAIEIGRRFVVAPDARLFSGSDRIRLVVPQERAFGTGSHATTSMCLELLEDVAGMRRRGIDIGTGSGILAIGMKKLGCETVLAFDNDPETLGVVRDNLRRNGMDPGEVPHFIAGMEAVRGGAFDLVTMNIIPEVIIPMLPRVSGLLAADAIVVLSGILEERADDVRAAASSAGLRLVTHRSSGEWWAGRFAFTG